MWREGARCSAWCDMIESISRPKLPRGRSYVLKTSQLADALAAAGVGWHVDLVYWSPHGGGSILEGHYWPPNSNVPYPRVYVRAGAVSSDVRAAAAETLSQTALPQFIRWLQGAHVAAGRVSRVVRRSVLQCHVYFRGTGRQRSTGVQAFQACAIVSARPQSVAADRSPHNQPLLWTGPRRVGMLSYSSASPARRVAGHRASSVIHLNVFRASRTISCLAQQSVSVHPMVAHLCCHLDLRLPKPTEEGPRRSQLRNG